MEPQVWLLALFAITAQAAGPECYTKPLIFGTRPDSSLPWLSRDWRSGCGTLPASARAQCETVSTNVSRGVGQNVPQDQILFHFKINALAFVKLNNAYQAILSTQIRKSEQENWGTVQELLNCLDVDCDILSYVLAQEGVANKIGAAMRADCNKTFPVTDLDEFITCVFTSGQVSSATNAQNLLKVLMEYTMNNTNTARKNFLNTIKIDEWGGSVAQGLECAGTDKCEQLLPLLVYVSVDGIANTKFTASMNTECFAKFPAPNPQNLPCRTCKSAIELAVQRNQASTLSELGKAYANCGNDPAWKAAFTNIIASWGTVAEAAACSSFVLPTTPVPGSTGATGTTGTTTAPPSAECQARRELLQKANNEYRIIAPLLAQCQFMNSTEKAACESVTSTMRTIADSTSTENKKLEDISNALTNYGIISPFKAVTLQTTDIGSWTATTKNYFRFITCQSKGNCNSSQIMFATLPSGGSYVLESITTACQRNNAIAACTNLTNEIKRCTMGAMNFFPATEADRLVRAQFIVANSTTVRLDRNAPFGEWGTVDQFLKCTLP